MSLYILDTDILTLLRAAHPVVSQRALAHSPNELAITIISDEEQLKGWFTQLRKAKKQDELARAYRHLTKTIQVLSGWQIFSFTEPVIVRYQQLRVLRLNIGSPDLRISAIALENGAVLVTRNVRDFQRVPNPVIEDWTV